MKCNDCNSTTIIETRSAEVCHECGLVHSDQLYDFGPIISDAEGYDTFEPLLDNEKLAIDTVKRLKNWLNRDISLQLEMSLVQEVEKLADELVLYDQKCYPSQYYWAGAIIYARKYDHVSRKQVVEYLYGRFDGGCERMLKKLDKIIHEKDEHEKTLQKTHDVTLTKLKAKLNQDSVNRFDEYLKNEWLNKIIKGETIRQAKDYTVKELARRTKIDAKKYKNNKHRLINGGYKQMGRKGLFDKYPNVGKLVLDLYNIDGIPGYKIPEILEQDLLNYVEYETYHNIVPCSRQTVYDFINKNKSK